MDFIRASPITRILLAAAIGMLACAIATAYLLAQPTLGVKLTPDFPRNELQLQELRTALPPLALHQDGPWRLAGLSWPGASQVMPLTANDRIEEPDLLPSYADQALFMQRQEQLYQAIHTARLQQQPITLHFADPNAQTITFTTIPSSARLQDLPITFWVQCAAAIASLLLGGWAWSLQPNDPATRAFAASGVALFLSVASASVYSSRELALDADVFRWLAAINHFGVHLFAAAMINLFLIYPQRLVKRWPLVLIYVFFLSNWILDSLRWLPNAAWGNIYPTLYGTALIITFALLQWIRSRHDPIGRAAIRWMGLVTGLACSFYTLAMLPNWLSGAGTSLDQAWAFVFFMLIYAGLAFGVSRYRLFELDQWAYRILIYALATMMLIGLDGILVYALHISALQSLALSLMVVGFTYLPLRNLIWSRMVHDKKLSEQDIFKAVLDIVLANTDHARTQHWQALLQGLFQPLDIERLPVSSLDTTPHLVRLEHDGLDMLLPDTQPSHALRLRYPRKGRGIFGPPHVQQAKQLLGLLHYAEDSRTAFARGASHERHRIAQDLHDDIGAALLSGLHKTNPQEIHHILRGTMQDIRSIVTGLTGQAESLPELMAALRYETAERLDAANLNLDWSSPELPVQLVSYLQIKNLRACLREGVSNILQHSRAQNVQVNVTLQAQQLEIRLCNDGVDGPPAISRSGYGLINIQRRMADIQGSAMFDSTSTHNRATLTLRMPLLDSETPLCLPPQLATPAH